MLGSVLVNEHLATPGHSVAERPKVKDGLPGTGRFTLPVARRIGADGALHLLDIHQAMLDQVVRRAKQQDIANLLPARGDATTLPYETESFDAVFLVTVLGEIPDRKTALREARRVLRPRGRLVVGEAIHDPDMVRWATLERECREAGYALERRVGGPLGFFARFVLSG